MSWLNFQGGKLRNGCIDRQDVAEEFYKQSWEKISHAASNRFSVYLVVLINKFRSDPKSQKTLVNDKESFFLLCYGEGVLKPK
jgi:hypothetical protein